MSVQTSARYVHVGRQDKLSGFAIELNEFYRLGNKVFDLVSMRDYPQTTMLLGPNPWIFGPLYCFMLLEELEQLIPVVKPHLSQREMDQLTLIYNNAKYQAFESTMVTVELQ